MSLSLDVRQPLAGSLRRLLSREFEQSLRRLDQTCQGKPRDCVEGVHEFRRSVKRLRATIALMGDGVSIRECRAMDRALSEAARRLGSLRDAHARRIAAERVAMLLPRQLRALAMDAWRMSGGSVSEAAAGLSVQGIQELVEASRREMEAIRDRAMALDFREVDAKVVANAVVKAWGRARNRYQSSWKGRDEAWLHGVRKRTQRVANVLVMVQSWGGAWVKNSERRLRLAAGALGEARDAKLMLDRIPEQIAGSPLYEVVHTLRIAANRHYAARLRAAQREGLRALKQGRSACKKQLVGGAAKD